MGDGLYDFIMTVCGTGCLRQMSNTEDLMRNGLAGRRRRACRAIFLAGFAVLGGGDFAIRRLLTRQHPQLLADYRADPTADALVDLVKDQGGRGVGVGQDTFEG